MAARFDCVIVIAGEKRIIPILIVRSELRAEKYRLYEWCGVSYGRRGVGYTNVK